MSEIRRAAVAGTWYPATAGAIAREVDSYLADAIRTLPGELVALIAPHAGLMYSGPVAAHAYRLLRDHRFDTIVLVGPSHFVGFDGVALYAGGGFETPLGTAPIDREIAEAILRATPVVRPLSMPHAREHSLEMQLPFVQHLARGAAIVPMLMGYQTPATAGALGDALAEVLRGRSALLVASSDLSHYHDAATAAHMDAVVLDCVTRFDPEGLQRALDRQPEHACGGGPAVAVMRAARALGATDGIVLDYGDSGDVSGDKSAVVGYMAAAFGTFTTRPATPDTTDTAEA